MASVTLKASEPKGVASTAISISCLPFSSAPFFAEIATVRASGKERLLLGDLRRLERVLLLAVAVLERQVGERHLAAVDLDAGHADQRGVGEPVLDAEADAARDVLQAAEVVHLL